ncbi:MAG: hypothetical protein M5U28_07605 [Sandaracinaceae bacterium]|nr:hypothetical protein [Sandaracinaceae bacterium]
MAVAIILFEGGLSLEWRRIKREGRAIRQLMITLGALARSPRRGGVRGPRWCLEWEWQRSLLFGTLVVVTGPTVVTPLLPQDAREEERGHRARGGGRAHRTPSARSRLRSRSSWCCGPRARPGRRDAHDPRQAPLRQRGRPAHRAPARRSLRFCNVVPEARERVHARHGRPGLRAAERDRPRESGIAAVIVCGMVVGNSRTHAGKELAESKSSSP